MRCVTAAVIVAVLLVGTAAAQSRDDDWAWCKDFRSNPDPIIEACTAIIQAGQEPAKGLALAFTSRGTAFGRKREYDRAIQDLNQAITLDPNSALAFSNRGTAYNSKREYDRAIQDLDQPTTLQPNSPPYISNPGIAYN